jgi:hypothetical protein
MLYYSQRDERAEISTLEMKIKKVKSENSSVKTSAALTPLLVQ